MLRKKLVQGTTKKNEKEGQDGNMLNNMANLSDDEDFGDFNMDNAVMQENKHKADREFLNEELEVLTKWKNGKEYKSEHFTSSAGGKLIINTIIKKTKKGKRRQREIEEEEKKEKDAKKSSQADIKKTDLDLIQDKLDKLGDDAEEIMEVEECDEDNEDYDDDEAVNWSEDGDCKDGDNNESDEGSEESYSSLPKLERMQKLDAKRPDEIDGMKVQKVVEYEPLNLGEDLPAQNQIDLDRVDPVSDDEDYLMGTIDRIKVKGLPVLSAEVINDKFTSNKAELKGFNIIKEKRAEIRNKKIVLVDKDAEQDKEDSQDEDLQEEERQAQIDKLKGQKRRGAKLTDEEKKARKDAIKEVKNERKVKKQNFKNKFNENMKVGGARAEQQVKNGGTLQGVNIVKIN